MNEKKDYVISNVFINIYVHYPETLNGTIICDKIALQFNEYYKCNGYDVSVKTAPNNEKEMIIVDILGAKNKEMIDVIKLKNSLSNIFNNRIEDIRINIYDHN